MIQHYVGIHLEPVRVAHCNHPKKLILSSEPRPNSTLLILLAKVVVVIGCVTHIRVDSIRLARLRRPNTVEPHRSQPRSQFRQIGVPAGVLSISAVPPERLQDGFSIPWVGHGDSNRLAGPGVRTVCGHPQTSASAES